MSSVYPWAWANPKLQVLITIEVNTTALATALTFRRPLFVQPQCLTRSSMTYLIDGIILCGATGFWYHHTVPRDHGSESYGATVAAEDSRDAHMLPGDSKKHLQQVPYRPMIHRATSARATSAPEANQTLPIRTLLSLSMITVPSRRSRQNTRLRIKMAVRFR